PRIVDRHGLDAIIVDDLCVPEKAVGYIVVIAMDKNEDLAVSRLALPQGRIQVGNHGFPAIDWVVGECCEMPRGIWSPATCLHMPWSMSLRDPDLEFGKIQCVRPFCRVRPCRIIRSLP